MLQLMSLMLAACLRATTMHQTFAIAEKRVLAQLPAQRSAARGKAGVGGCSRSEVAADVSKKRLSSYTASMPGICQHWKACRQRRSERRTSRRAVRAQRWRTKMLLGWLKSSGQK